MRFVIPLFLLFILVYWFGVARSIFAGDSADIIISYYFGTFAHPPGFPLNVLLGFILTKLPLGESFAFRANFVSAIFSAATVSITFVLLRKLTGNFLVSLTAAFVLAFVPLFWLYAHVAEVFELNTLLIAGSLLLLFNWETGKNAGKSLVSVYLSFLLYGVAVFHHQTSLLLAPAYIFYIFKMKKYYKFEKYFYLKLLAILIVGILPYLLIFVPSFSKGPSAYADQSLLGLVSLITRSDYGTFSASPDLIGFSPIARLLQVYWYLKVVTNDFTVFGVFLACIGFLWLLFNKKTWFGFFALATFFTGPFFLVYASFPLIDSFLLGTAERFLILNYLFLAILVGFGILSSVNFLQNVLKRKIQNKQVIAALPIVFLVFPIVLFLVNFKKADLSDEKIGQILAEDVLNSAQPPGIIFLTGDTVSFNTQYMYYVEGVNSSSKIILMGKLKRENYKKRLVQDYSELSFSEKFKETSALRPDILFLELVGANIDKYPIYITDPLPLSSNYVWIQQGMLSRLYMADSVPKDSEVVEHVNNGISRIQFNESDYLGRYSQFFTDSIKGAYAKVFSRNAYELLNHGAFVDAGKNFEKSLAINKDSEEAQYGLGVSRLEQGDCSNSEKIFTQILDNNSSYASAWDGLAAVFKSCYKDELKAEEYKKRAIEVRKGEIDTPLDKL